MFSNRSNPSLCQVSMFNTSPISRKCDITVRTCKLLRHIIPLEEIDRNCLQLSYALFFGLIHISLTFSERDVGTALSYRDKNHFGASISRKTNFKSSIWKWQRRHFGKLLEVARFSLRDVTMAEIVRTNKLPSSPPWWPYDTRRKQSKCIHFLDFLYFPIYSRRNYSVGTNTSFSWFQVIHFKPLTFLKNCCSKSLSTFDCWVSFLDLESIKVPNHPFRMDGLALLCWQGMIHFHSGILLSA